MANVFDYLDWRGDLPMELAPFCDVDALVLARFAYLPLDGVAPAALRDGLTIGEAERALWKHHRGDAPFLNLQDRKLLSAMAESRRFGWLRVFGFEHHFDPVALKQFSAVTVQLTDDTVFVAYRGTDDTLVGWQEDFNMGFLHPVPAQEEAVRYLRRVAEGIDGGIRIRAGGHSKGGNLAVYASAFAGEDIQRRVLSIHNLDGPGFPAETLAAPSFVAIKDLIHTFLPQSSIVGMLLDHEEDYTVVHSTNMGPMQHNVYSWQMLGPRFVQLQQISAGSSFVNHSLKDWIAGMTPAQRQTFAQALGQVLGALGVTRLGELRQNLPQRARDVMSSLRGVDPETRQVLMKTLSALVQSAFTTAWEGWNKNGE